MKPLKRYTPLLILVILALAVLPACVITDLLNKEEKEATPIVVVVPADGEAPAEEPSAPAEPVEPASPTDAPAPVVAPVASEQGMGRDNPYPMSALAIAPNLEVQVLEVKRGADAWADISAANQFNEPPPEGMEFVLIKVHVKSTHADSEEHTIGDCDFNVTGDLGIRYRCTMAFVSEPDPQLDATLFSGGETEGWISYPVGIGEGNLMLEVDELFNWEEGTLRYIALEEGASLSIPAEIAAITPTGLGKARLEPAAVNQTVITEDWEITVLEFVRGEAALNMVMEANSYNDPPESGMEFIAVKVRARCIGDEDKAYNIDEYSFKTTGSANNLYDTPSVVDPEPALYAYLYPGGVYEGWFVVQAAIGETDVLLIYEEFLDFSGDSKRFIALD